MAATRDLCSVFPVISSFSYFLSDLNGTWSLNEEWVYLNKNEDSQNMHLKFIYNFKFISHFKCLALKPMDVLSFCYHIWPPLLNSILKSEVTSKSWKFYINSNCFFILRKHQCLTENEFHSFTRQQDILLNNADLSIK